MAELPSIGVAALVASRIARGSPQRVSLTQQESSTEVLELEATLEEGHTGTAETTDHPVESGADVTDHIRRKPDELTLKAIVSNTPILLLAFIRAEPSVPGGDPQTRAEDAYEWLRNVKDLGLLLNVSTTLRDYTSMAITGISVIRDKDRSRILEVNITLREIIIAVTEKSTLEVPGAASNLGRKAAKAASAATTASQSSILASLIGALGF
jgi:hypothetical protein